MRLLIAIGAATVTAAAGVFLVRVPGESGRTTESPAPAPYVQQGSPPVAARSLPTETGRTPQGTVRVAPQTVARQRVYAFPVEGCRATYARGHHDYPAADLMTDAGCRFVAPITGRVDEVSRVDRWDPPSNRGADRGGLSVSVIGIDGVRYYGSHLSAVDPAVVPGARVRAGQVLGRVGRSGSARYTAHHLHFGISWPTAAGHWWIRRGVVAPQPFLDEWGAGRDASPAAVVRRARGRR